MKSSLMSKVLLSSHRDYLEDREWQYLRAERGLKYLRFEGRGDGTSELVVLPGWPRMVFSIQIRMRR